MSGDALPISPARFAGAIKDLSLSSLHLKVLEIRNDISHLDYSNEQLLPYAKGTAAVLGAAAADEAKPDQDCVDAIRENLVVIERKLEQIRLVRAEVEHRGASWTEFQSKEEVEQQQAEAEQRAARTGSALAAAHQAATAAGEEAAPSATTTATATNGESTNHGGHGPTSTSTTGNPWTDGTFQTGTIRNGELHMDPVPGQAFSASAAGGSLTDEQLRRALEERLGLRQNGESHDDDEEEGLHL